MSRSDHDRRRLATVSVVVAAVLAVAGIAVLSVAFFGLHHSSTPPASAARPNAERNLAPTVTSSPTTTPGRATPSTTPSSSRPAVAPPPATVGPVLKRSVPVAITASRIQVKAAPLAQYGLDAQGAIAVPPSTATTPAGWYTGSPTPGQTSHGLRCQAAACRVCWFEVVASE